MANKGSYVISLKKAHLEWGTHRYTGSRGDVYGEGYIPIPAEYAQSLKLYNSNKTAGRDVIGENIFHCVSVDGLFNGEVKAQGCSCEGDPYAKQFSGNNDLKAIGSWYASINAQVGDKIRVTVTGYDTIEIEKL